MTTPKRWIDERSDADDFERAILRSELDAAPPADRESEIFSRVLAAVAPIPGGLGPSGAAPGGALGGGALAKAAATLGGLGKGFALGIGVSAAVAAGSHYLGDGSSRDAAVSTAAPSVHPAPASVAASGRERAVAAPVEAAGDSHGEASQHVGVPESDRRAVGAVGNAPPPTPQATELERTPGAPSVASFAPTDSASLAASRLKEEAALLRRARAELRSGALTAAFATLEASRREFTAPELYQEREALSIELLFRSGERAAAAARAREFLSRFPESPHAAALRVFAD